MFVKFISRSFSDEGGHQLTKGKSGVDSASRRDSWRLGKRVNECSMGV